MTPITELEFKRLIVKYNSPFTALPIDVRQDVIDLMGHIEAQNQLLLRQRLDLQSAI